MNSAEPPAGPPPEARPPSQPRPGNPWRWVVAAAVALVVSILSLRSYFPPLPNPLELELILERGEPGRSEPLITTGRPESGDFLFVRRLADDRLVFGYEAWGSPSRLSVPVARPADGRIHLRVSMPALHHVRGVFASYDSGLRLEVDGAVLFDLPQVEFHERLATEVRLAENPNGGTACGPELKGKLRLPDGRALLGVPWPLMGWRERICAWLFVSRWPALGALLLGFAAFQLWPRVGSGWFSVARLTEWSGTAFRGVRRHRHFAVAGAGCTVAFAWLVSYGTLQLVAPEPFGNFYDYQASSLLHGRLDVPRDAIGGEAFVYDGKNYGYFGVTPALLRLPLVIFNLGFGEVTRAFMVAYFAGTLLAAYLLLRVARSVLGHGAEPPSAWATWSLLGSVGLGSSVFFLGSRAYVYHEAILCGILFAVLATWAAFRHYLAPERRWWLGSLTCGILSVHARPPTGLFALTLLGAVGVVVALENRRGRTAMPGRRTAVILAACAAGVLSFNVLSYLKFRSFEGCPLRLNVQYDAARLARIDGKQFHLVNLPFMVDRYLLRPNFRLEPHFPYLFVIEGLRDDEWARTKIDYHEPTLAFPYAMPGLFGLAALGGISAFAAYPIRRRLLGAVAAAGLPMSVAMGTAIAITQRYTADFCPFLLAGAAFGTAAFESARGRWATAARGAVVVAAVAAVLITAAITFHYQGKKVWGVPEEARARYVGWCRAIDTLTGDTPPKP